MAEDREQELGLRDIARWLTTPSQSGVYFSLDDLDRIGNQVGIQGLPRNRRFAVEQLFRSSALDDRLEDLLDVLDGELAVHIERYRECDHEALAPWIALAGSALLRVDEMRHDLPA